MTALPARSLMLVFLPLVIAQAPLEKAKYESETENQKNNSGNVNQSTHPIVSAPTGTSSDSQTAKHATSTQHQPYQFLWYRDVEWSQWFLIGLAGIAAYYTWGAFGAAKRQADTAEEQLRLATSPRLHIDEVRVSSLEVGASPVFFVKIVNSGHGHALDVSVKMKVAVEGKSVAYQYDQIHMIPANGSREYFIRPNFLGESEIQGIINGTLPLEVSGHFNYGKETPYCYKYNAWSEESPRPNGFPTFIPCDFKLLRDIRMKVETANFKVS